jgi:glycosyltransferase involved in cell wall biosynthesis
VITGEPNPTPIEGVAFLVTPLLNLVRRSANVRNGSIRDLQSVRSLLGGIIEGDGLDVVHGHNLHHFTPQPALALNELRERIGFRLHHTFHETWPDLLHDRPVYRSWDGNYAVSAFVQRECTRRLGFRPRLLRLGVDTQRFAPRRSVRRPASQPVNILHPARLLPWKGVDLSIRMLRMLLDRGIDARLLVTDTQRIVDWNDELEDYRRSIDAMIKAFELTGAVDLIAPRHDEMPMLYALADVVVYPTLADEPFGLVPLESMSCSKPVIAAACGGIVETVVDGRTGFLFPPGDVETFSERVARVVVDPSLSQRLGDEGRRRVLRSFNLERYTDRLLGLYAV